MLHKCFNILKIKRFFRSSQKQRNKLKNDARIMNWHCKPFFKILGFSLETKVRFFQPVGTSNIASMRSKRLTSSPALSPLSTARSQQRQQLRRCENWICWGNSDSLTWITVTLGIWLNKTYILPWCMCGFLVGMGADVASANPLPNNEKMPLASSPNSGSQILVGPTNRNDLEWEFRRSW